MKLRIVAMLLAWPVAASAQDKACPSPAYEKRLVAGIARDEPKIDSKIPVAKGELYARCYARLVCAKNLDKAEFEMLTLGELSALGDDKADKEFLRRMPRERAKNNGAMDKIDNPNALRAACLREIKS